MRDMLDIRDLTRYMVTETLPDGRERALSGPVSLAEAERIFAERVRWAGVIREWRAF